MGSLQVVRVLVVLAVGALAACSGGSGAGVTPTPTTKGGPVAPSIVASSPAAPAASGSGVAPGTPGVAGKPGVVTGSIVTTGPYAATFTFVVGMNGVRRDGLVGLTSDKGTTPGQGPEADVQVRPNGEITFGAMTTGQGVEEVPDVMRVNQFTGTGGHPDVRADADGNIYVCGFTLDNDLAPPAGTPILHVKGTITISGSMPTPLGPIDC